MLIFKILGLALVLLTSTFLGLNKTATLKSRAKKLNLICTGLSNMAHLIKNGADELDNILKMSFNVGVIQFDSNKYGLNKGFLKKQEIADFDEFINSIGILDRQSEYKRIMSFISIFEKRFQEAQKNYNELSKIYNTLGFLVGLSLCIFLI